MKGLYRVYVNKKSKVVIVGSKYQTIESEPNTTKGLIRGIKKKTGL